MEGEENQIQEVEVEVPHWLGEAEEERNLETVVAAAAEPPADSTGSRRDNSDSRRRPHMGPTRSTEHTEHCSQSSFQQHSRRALL